jgi:hypothetical protein
MSSAHEFILSRSAVNENHVAIPHTSTLQLNLFSKGGLRAWKSPVLSVLVVLETFSRSSADAEVKLRLKMRLRVRMIGTDFFMACTPFALRYREEKIYQGLSTKSRE